MGVFRHAERGDYQNAMPTATIHLRTPIQRTPRVAQIEGLFDLTSSAVAERVWTVELPLEEKPWNIGLVVGPSGSGKSTLARRLWPGDMAHEPVWPDDRAIIDAFPERMRIKEIARLLSSVGFSSPPAWLRPYRVLSTGQQFRVKLARLLAEAGSQQITVFDEFASTVDRSVARIASLALAKTVRARV